MEADKVFRQTLVTVGMISESKALPVAVQMLNSGYVPHAPISTGEGCIILTL